VAFGSRHYATRHNRAIRLTVGRLESRLPKSMAEIQADKDLLRAEFAMSARHFEITIEQLKSKITNQLVELSKKSDLISQLNVERNELKAEITKLRREHAGVQKGY
jgi:chromosome segregation ATPase